MNIFLIISMSVLSIIILVGVIKLVIGEFKISLRSGMVAVGFFVFVLITILGVAIEIASGIS